MTAPTVTEARVKQGKLTLGGTDFSCQPTNIRISPTFNDKGDVVETLCGDQLPKDTIASWEVNGTAIQDFDDPDGFVLYTIQNNLVSVPFTWQPNTTTGLKVAGNVSVRALEVGGDVNMRITSDFNFPCVGTPVFTPPTGVAGTSQLEITPAGATDEPNAEGRWYTPPDPAKGSGDEGET